MIRHPPRSPLFPYPTLSRSAATRPVSAPPSRHVPIAAREARGCTRTRSSPSSGRAGIRVVGRQVAAEQTVVALERRGQLLHELPPRALERRDVGADLPLLGARGLHRLLAGQLGLAQDQLGLPPGIVLHLLAQALGRDQRFLQGALALGDAARALLLGRNLLFEQRRLLEQRLVVLGHVVEEGVA